MMEIFGYLMVTGWFLVLGVLSLVALLTGQKAHLVYWWAAVGAGALFAVVWWRILAK